MSCKVSVLIPVYNQEKLIHKCINSIPKRSDIEIIAVDDCSTDNSFNEIKQHFPFVNLLHLNKNTGIGNVRNRLIKEAKGDYLYFLDSDDFIYSDAFNRCIDTIDNSDEIIETKHEQNNGHVWYCHVFRGAFIKREIAQSVSFRDMRVHEDTYWKKDILKSYPNIHIRKFEEIVYHYNCPRAGSLSDLAKKEKSIFDSMMEMQK